LFTFISCDKYKNIIEIFEFQCGEDQALNKKGLNADDIIIQLDLRNWSTKLTLSALLLLIAAEERKVNLSIIDS
jgi:hypothetical protein